MSTATKPLALLSSGDAERNEHGVYTIGRTVLGNMHESHGRVLAHSGKESAACATTAQALAWLVAVANARKIRAALTAAGHKAPTKGGYAGIVVAAFNDGTVQVRYLSRGFGSIINGITRSNEMRAVRDSLIARGIPAELRPDGSDRYGDREVVVVHAR